MKSKKLISILMVGCGGVGSLAARILHTSLRCSVSFIDGDTFEPKNENRQTFDKSHMGVNKAESMSRHYGGDYYPFFITPEFNEKHDIILCAVDNHAARRTCLKLAEEWGVPCVVAANEIESSMVYIHYGDIAVDNPEYSALTWFPDLLSEDEDERDPSQSCAAIINTDQGAQTFMANAVSATTACQAIVRIINMQEAGLPRNEFPAYYYICNGMFNYSPLNKLYNIFPFVFTTPTDEVPA